jgi:hypothetical protein
MKGAFSWLVHWARCACTRDLCPALAALVSPLQNIIFPLRTLFNFICPHRPASWAGSRAGSPVSYVSLVFTYFCTLLIESSVKDSDRDLGPLYLKLFRNNHNL